MRWTDGHCVHEMDRWTLCMRWTLCVCMRWTDGHCVHEVDRYVCVHEMDRHMGVPTHNGEGMGEECC